MVVSYSFKDEKVGGKFGHSITGGIYHGRHYDGIWNRCQ